MAAGDRKIKVMAIRIARGGGTIQYVAEYQFLVQDSTGTDQFISAGVVSGNFGTPANFGAMTGAQMNTQVISDVTAAQASGVPAGTVS
jgi:hypothetical protein